MRSQLAQLVGSACQTPSPLLGLASHHGVYGGAQPDSERTQARRASAR
jgi:hypothetical protein